MPCMMIENCCYGEVELMCLNLAKQGAFGEIVHCTGAYFHDVRREISSGVEERHYRLRNYIGRNCDNYPTHALGPIAKLLNVNRGNRFLSLVSMASKARGLHEYVVEKRGEDDALAKVDFKQGDVVTTLINCANGETIRLTLATTTSHPYSRDFGVVGTQGLFQEDTNALYLKKDLDKYHPTESGMRPFWNNVKAFKEEYNHPLWSEYNSAGVKAGHGGMDWLVLRAFFESAMYKKETPIDVYDTAAWMSITALSEESVAKGGNAVAVPDFTNGKWLKDKDRVRDEVPTYSLQTLPVFSFLPNILGQKCRGCKKGVGIVFFEKLSHLNKSYPGQYHLAESVFVITCDHLVGVQSLGGLKPDADDVYIVFFKNSVNRRSSFHRFFKARR